MHAIKVPVHSIESWFNDLCYSLLTTAFIHGCMCSSFTAFLAHDTCAHKNADTHICCASWANDILGNFVNLTPICSRFSSVPLLNISYYLECNLLNKTFSYICMMLSYFWKAHQDTFFLQCVTILLIATILSFVPYKNINSDYTHLRTSLTCSTGASWWLGWWVTSGTEQNVTSNYPRVHHGHHKIHTLLLNFFHQSF